MILHVYLLNLSKEFRKGVQMRGLQNILSLFCNNFNESNNIGVQIEDSFYHMTLKLGQIKKIPLFRVTRTLPKFTGET